MASVAVRVGTGGSPTATDAVITAPIPSGYTPQQFTGNGTVRYAGTAYQVAISLGTSTFSFQWPASVTLPSGATVTVDMELFTDIGFTEQMAWRSFEARKRARALRRFWLKLGGRASAPCNIVAVGDSITEGYPPSGVRTNLLTEECWRALLVSKLRSAFPTSGAAGTGGYYAALHNNVEPNDYPVTRNGVLSQNASGFGLRNVFLRAAGNYVEFTCPANTTSVDVIWHRTPSASNFSWQINGGAATNVTASGTDTDGMVTNITGVVAGDKIRVNYVSGAGALINGFFAYGGDEAKGIRMWDSGRATVTCSTLVASSTSVWFQNFNVVQPDLVMILIGANDASKTNGLRTSAQFAADLQTLITNIKAQCTVAPSIMLMTQWQVSTPVEPWENYVNVIKAAAAADDDIMFFDMRNIIWKRPFGSDTAGGMLVDYIHPGREASEILADGLLNVIRPGMAHLL